MSFSSTAASKMLCHWSDLLFSSATLTVIGLRLQIRLSVLFLSVAYGIYLGVPGSVWIP